MLPKFINLGVPASRAVPVARSLVCDLFRVSVPVGSQPSLLLWSAVKQCFPPPALFTLWLSVHFSKIYFPNNYALVFYGIIRNGIILHK